MALGNFRMSEWASERECLCVNAWVDKGMCMYEINSSWFLASLASLCPGLSSISETEESQKNHILESCNSVQVR